MKYKVGDKVRIVDHWNSKSNENQSGHMDEWLGKVMTISEVCKGYYRMEEDCEQHRIIGWCWNEHTIAGLAEEENPFHNETVIITCHGKRTKILHKQNEVIVRQEYVYRNEDDAYDFSVAATMGLHKVGLLNGYAVKEIESREEVKAAAEPIRFPYEGRVVCVDNCGNTSLYTVGKIYRFVGGVLTNDLGGKMIKLNDVPFYSFEEFAKYSGSKWIEITGEG